MKVKLQWHEPIVNLWELNNDRTRWDSLIHLMRIKESDQPYTVAWQFKLFNITLSLWWESDKNQIEESETISTDHEKATE